MEKRPYEGKDGYTRDSRILLCRVCGDRYQI